MSEQRLPRPTVPALLQADWDTNEHLQAWHATLQHHTIESYQRTSPVGRLALSGVHTGEGIRYVDIMPPDVADEKDAIVIMHNFAGGWGVRGAVRHEALLASLPEPRRLLAFPNAIVGHEVATYSFNERRRLAAGDLAPLADRVLATCRSLGIRSIQTAGYSQGASTGAAVLARAADQGIEAGHSGLFDPPNVVERTSLALARDFVATGVANGFRASQAARIPLIDEANGPASRDRAMDRLRAIRNYTHPHNRALGRGLTHRTFGRDANTFLRAFPDAQLLCMRAELSTVTPRAAYEKQVRYLSHYRERVRSVTIPDIGHEFAENPIAYALLGARALYPR